MFARYLKFHLPFAICLVCIAVLFAYTFPDLRQSKYLQPTLLRLCILAVAQLGRQLDRKNVSRWIPFKSARVAMERDGHGVWSKRKRFGL